MLLYGNRDCPTDGLGEAQADLRFDPNAMGTQSFCLDLAEFAADPADLFHLPSVEETQTYRGHCGPSREIGQRNVGVPTPERPNLQSGCRP
jgi:hypothetical protein